MVALTLTARGVTPEVGKERLRQLLKLPAVSFQPNWGFDAGRGFTLGVGTEDAREQVAKLRKELTKDSADPESFQDLAELYASLNENAKAGGAWHRAAELYRRRVGSTPDDSGLLTGFGLALAATGKSSEAESVLRRAVRGAPKNWRCWVALGRFLDDDARQRVLTGTTQAVELTDGTDNAGITSVGLPPNLVAQAQKELDEATDCFDKAVEVAPEEGEVYYRRGMHRSLRAMLRNQIAGTSRTDGEDPMKDYFSSESLADLQKASRLNPTDYRMIGATALFEVYTYGGRNGQLSWSDFSWDSLPDKSQRSLRQSITRLEDLAGAPEPRVAAGALEVLGVLQGTVLRASRSSIVNLRRAVTLDPSRDQAWELLAGTLVQSGHYDELLAACEDRVKSQGSARSHILLAKAFERVRQWDNAEAEIAAALSQEPDNMTACLAIAALIMKRGHTDASVTEAGNWLTRAELVLARTPTTQRTQQLLVDFTLIRAVNFALADDLENARRWVKAVLEEDKDNKLAQDIMAAMDY